MADIDLDRDEIFALVNAQAQVKAGVRGRASRMTARIRRELAKTGIDASVSIRDHPLPTGRTSVDVVVEPTNPKDERRVGRIARNAGRAVRR